MSLYAGLEPLSCHIYAIKFSRSFGKYQLSTGHEALAQASPYMASRPSGRVCVAWRMSVSKWKSLSVNNTSLTQRNIPTED